MMGPIVQLDRGEDVVLENEIAVRAARMEDLETLVDFNLKMADETELAVLSKLVEDLRENYSKNLVLANEICKGISIEKDEDKARVASLTMLVNALYNLDVTKTRE